MNKPKTHLTKDTPVTYLLRIRDAKISRLDLLAELLERAKARGEVPQDRPVRVATTRAFFEDGKNIAWARRSALELALELNWRIETAEAAADAIKTFRSWKPDGTLDAFHEFARTALQSDHSLALVRDAWLRSAA